MQQQQIVCHQTDVHYPRTKAFVDQCMLNAGVAVAVADMQNMRCKPVVSMYARSSYALLLKATATQLR
jgi:hypothetical protein